MTRYSYDDLYGIDLDIYCEAHETSIGQLIRKIKIDIDLLTNNLRDLVKVHYLEQNSQLINYISSTIDKKRKHIERLEEWE
jgi:hypothetical protein